MNNKKVNAFFLFGKIDDIPIRCKESPLLLTQLTFKIFSIYIFCDIIYIVLLKVDMTMIRLQRLVQ